ncbi:hypothetical protein HAX54_028180, partial [Datura stramonium]|nr:hypothetical protein [Datura stramonium]
MGGSWDHGEGEMMKERWVLGSGKDFQSDGLATGQVQSTSQSMFKCYIYLCWTCGRRWVPRFRSSKCRWLAIHLPFFRFSSRYSGLGLCHTCVSWVGTCVSQ